MQPTDLTQLVNDVHSGLNPTRVVSVIAPRDVGEIRAALAFGAAQDLPLAICGGRHAMGGQQFCGGALLLDMRAMARVLSFDPVRGLLEAEAGIEWPALVDYLEHAPAGEGGRWSIRQKQTGADQLTLGGCLAANVHGRGLRMRPFIEDVEAFTLVDAAGVVHTCSRSENRDLFGLAIGGYGLFGVIASVTLRLARRRKMRRDVGLVNVDQLMAAFEQRLADGYEFGDLQFAIDPASADFMQLGVFSCYLPVPDDTPMGSDDKVLAEAEWRQLLALAHTDKSLAFDCYARHYLASAGQVYWSDRLQLTTYLDGYHQELDALLGHVGSEVIGELYVPRARLVDFMRAAAADLRRHGVDLIYGTIRLIEAERESALPWARQDYACVIFNLHTRHTPDGEEATKQAFRRLIDLAIERDGSFYLTYGRAATRAQVQACYPGFPAMLAAKLRHDPDQRIQSNWYRHYRDLFGADGEGA